MSTISVTNINDGDAVTAASINNQVNTIVNDYNGNITAANLASNSVTTAKITNGNVTPDKLGTGAGAAYVATAETTTSTSYADLATTTDTVTATIGVNGLALVSISSGIANTTANAHTFIGFAVSGASTVAASDSYSIETQAYGANYGNHIAGVFLVTGLTTGSNVFKMKYKVTTGGGGAGTGTYTDRRISVVPL